MLIIRPLTIQCIIFVRNRIPRLSTFSYLRISIVKNENNCSERNLNSNWALVLSNWFKIFISICEWSCVWICHCHRDKTSPTVYDCDISISIDASYNYLNRDCGDFNECSQFMSWWMFVATSSTLTAIRTSDGRSSKLRLGGMNANDDSNAAMMTSMTRRYDRLTYTRIIRCVVCDCVAMQTRTMRRWSILA